MNIGDSHNVQRAFITVGVQGRNKIKMEILNFYMNCNLPSNTFITIT